MLGLRAESFPRPEIHSSLSAAPDEKLTKLRPLLPVTHFGLGHCPSSRIGVATNNHPFHRGEKCSPLRGLMLHLRVCFADEYGS